MKKVIPLITMLIVLILVMITFLTPWYTYHIKTPENTIIKEQDIEVNNHLTREEIIIEKENSKTTESKEYNTIKKDNPQLYSIFKEHISLFEITYYLMICILIVTIISISFSFAGIMKDSIKIKSIAVISCFITFFLMIITSLFFMLSWNEYSKNAVIYINSNLGFLSGIITVPKVDFWFSIEISRIPINGGPGLAWYLTLLGGIISFLSCICVILFFKDEPYISERTYFDENNKGKNPSLFPCPFCKNEIGLHRKVCPYCGHRIDIL